MPTDDWLSTLTASDAYEPFDLPGGVVGWESSPFRPAEPQPVEWEATFGGVEGDTIHITGRCSDWWGVVDMVAVCFAVWEGLTDG
jgi:hypothetical protein